MGDILSSSDLYPSLPYNGICVRSKIPLGGSGWIIGELSVPFVKVQVTRGDLVAHRYSYALPSFRTPRYRGTFIPHQVSILNDLVDSVDGVELRNFKSRARLLCWSELLSLILSSPVFSSSSFLLCVGVVRSGPSDWSRASTPSKPCNA